MADLAAGILNKRITIQESEETKDGEGGFTEVWSDVKTCWAQIKPFGAKQIYEYKSLNVKATHRIKIRANIVIEENNRICYKRKGSTRFFEVLTVEDELEAGVVKWVTCREVRN